jgi:pimeloyl-ACP methyl ester carboxylesterase
MPYADLPGDLRMYYEDDDFTDPWRPSETVIMQHGQAKNSQLWYAWVPLLARDYRIIRVDGRGFGRSSVPPAGYTWSLEGFATDLANLMDHLGIEKAHLIGETIGGTIGMQFALQYPQRLLSLTTCSSPFKFVGVPTYQEYYKLVEESGVEGWVRETISNRLSPDKADPAHVEWYIGQMSSTSRQTVLETLAYLATVDMTPVLPKISVPTLVLSGADAGASAERARVQASLIPGCRLIEVPGVSGFVQHEAPEQAAAAWREFARSVTAR